MTNFQTLCKTLEDKIKAAYTEGVTLADAEKLAGEFLYALMAVSSELKTTDLDARMRKAGAKAVRAAIYLSAAQGPEKKPTEATLAALVDTNDVVQQEQMGLDTAEVNRAELERFYEIFQNAHIHYRSVAKGSFGS